MSRGNIDMIVNADSLPACALTSIHAPMFAFWLKINSFIFFSRNGLYSQLHHNKIKKQCFFVKTLHFFYISVKINISKFDKWINLFVRTSQLVRCLGVRKTKGSILFVTNRKATASKSVIIMHNTK